MTSAGTELGSRLISGIGRDERNDFFTSDTRSAKSKSWFGRRNAPDTITTDTGGPFLNAYQDPGTSSASKWNKKKSSAGETIVNDTGGPFKNARLKPGKP